MPQSDTELPEGTDHIIRGAEETGGHGGSANRSAFSGLKEQLRETSLSLRSQATDRAREYATGGKDKATSVIDDIAQIVSEAAASVDDKLGGDYGQYAHRAADAMRSFNDSIRDKDVDQLYEDVRAFVKRSPAVAVGIAAAVGFALIRIAKAGAEEAPAKGASASDKPGPSPKA